MKLLRTLLSFAFCISVFCFVDRAYADVVYLQGNLDANSPATKQLPENGKWRALAEQVNFSTTLVLFRSDCSITTLTIAFQKRSRRVWNVRIYRDAGLGKFRSIGNLETLKFSSSGDLVTSPRIRLRSKSLKSTINFDGFTESTFNSAIDSFSQVTQCT